MDNNNKNAELILDKYLNNYPVIFSGKANAIKAMIEYAKQFEYDYSKTCTCSEADRIGETWCCNHCGLPSTMDSGYITCTDKKKICKEIQGAWCEQYNGCKDCPLNCL